MIKSLFAAIIASSAFSYANISYAAEAPFAIAIHGGAGTIEKSAFTPEQEKQYRAKLTEAVET
ncbi:MAG: beta-aspartyl-peptidase, partial [Pseudoalteromonas sp.]